MTAVRAIWYYLAEVNLQREHVRLNHLSLLSKETSDLFIIFIPSSQWRAQFR